MLRCSFSFSHVWKSNSVLHVMSALTTKEEEEEEEEEVMPRLLGPRPIKIAEEKRKDTKMFLLEIIIIVVVVVVVEGWKDRRIDLRAI
jgi:hypothetical protein